MGIKIEHFGTRALPLCAHFTHFLKKKTASDVHIKLPSISRPARTILDLIMFATKALLKAEKDEGPLT